MNTSDFFTANLAHATCWQSSDPRQLKNIERCSPAPHQPRLDWQMWFAALESYESNPWFMNLLHKLLLGDRDVLQLMGGNPFADAPPQYLRTQLYLYHYTRNTSSLWDVIFHPR